MFQHTAARRRLEAETAANVIRQIVSTHSRPKAAGKADAKRGFTRLVSTHSRPKAAGHEAQFYPAIRLGFNTQPPEGGWAPINAPRSILMRFQHTAARRRLERLQIQLCHGYGFNTQPPEGGWEQGDNSSPWVRFVSTHSRPKAAGDLLARYASASRVSTHSRPKAAGYIPPPARHGGKRFNTQPPEGGWVAAV